MINPTGEPFEAPDTGCFLNVDRSARGRAWTLRQGDERLATAHAERLGVNAVLGRILAGRSVPLEAGERFLNPTLRADMPDPHCLADMEAAVARTVRALQGGQALGVFGDYDVDGACSTALLVRYFRDLGVGLEVYIPDRLTEGYGPNPAAFEALRRGGADLLFTVDCGTAAETSLARAQEIGLDVIVLDHHTCPEALPAASALVNPQRGDDGSGLTYLAAAGVTFFFLVGLNRALREQGYFTPSRPEPDLKSLLDLVALGTVCDVVPLIGANRALTLTGLKIMAQRANPGLAALLEVSGVKDQPSAFHAGFMLGPRINAGGRIGASDLGSRLLSAQTAEEARKLAEKLDALNKERQSVEASVLSAATRAAELQLEKDDPPILVLGAEGWHPGVLGIVASRLKDRFARPAFVFGFDGDQPGSGSGRSLDGVDLGSAVLEAVAAGRAVKGGGHAMAAGASVTPQSLEAFRAFLCDRLSQEVTLARTRSVLELDGALAIGGANRTLVDLIARAGPFGRGNPEPLFALPHARVMRQDVVGKGHVRLILADDSGRRLKGIAFRAKENALGALLSEARDRTLHLAGRLKPDDWRDTKGVQFEVEDAALPA